MIRRVRLTTYAQADLDQIFAYIGRDNPRAAERYAHALQERCQCYAESPFIGRAEPLIAQRLQRPAENVRSFLYRVTNEEIRVLGYIDPRRDLDTALEERLPH